MARLFLGGSRDGTENSEQLVTERHLELNPGDPVEVPGGNGERELYLLRNDGDLHYLLTLPATWWRDGDPCPKCGNPKTKRTGIHLAPQPSGSSAKPYITIRCATCPEEITLPVDAMPKSA